MEENAAAVECLILFYINTKHILKTKQLDERVFLDQMTKHCKEYGFVAYSNEEIKNTWKNLLSKYVELKTNGTIEDKESWKYYEVLNSCYEQTDFHNGVYPKFSEEMVWFLIECFLKRKGLEKSLKRNSIVHDIHKEFLHCGYLYITKQDIENKWRYLNFKYDKLQDDPEAFNKLPYLQALRGYRIKDEKCVVKMIFTRELTDILIERFTEKKVTCVIHGYDSEQVLGEIQSEFRDLGFDFSLPDIKEKWTKLTNIYWFLKAKGKYDSTWIYFNAMRNHFKDDFLFALHKVDSGNVSTEPDNMFKRTLRQRSKSVGAEVRMKENSDIMRTKLVVNIEPLDKQKLSPKRKSVERKNILNKRPLTLKRPIKELISEPLKNKSRKKAKRSSKSREQFNRKENLSANYREGGKNKNFTNRLSRSSQTKDTISVRKATKLKTLTFDQNGNQDRSSSDVSSPGSKVHIINIDHSDIDKKSGNLTINLPSITKQFSDNEFLPLKKRLRLNDKHSDGSKESEEEFLGFPATEVETRNRLKQDSCDMKRLTEGEMAEIMEKINAEKSVKTGTNDNANNQEVIYKSDKFSYNYSETYNNFNRPCLIIPKEDRDNLSLQNYKNPNTVTPPPVLLLVIKVDGSNKDPGKEGTTSNVKKDAEGKLYDSPEKVVSGTPNNISKQCTKNKECSPIKPIVLKSPNCTITEQASGVIMSNEKKKVSDCENKSRESVDIVLPEVLPENKSCTINKNITKQGTEMQNNEVIVAQLQNNSLEKLSKSKICNLTANEKVSSKDEEIKTNGTSKTTPVQISNDTSYQNLPTIEKSGESSIIDTHTKANIEKSTSTTQVLQQHPSTKTIRLPIKGGGKFKEIYLSARELNKIAKLTPDDFKIKNKLTKTVNDDVGKGDSNPSTSITKPRQKIQYVSQTIKPAMMQYSVDNTAEKITPKAKNKISTTIDLTDDTSHTLPTPSIITSDNFLGTNKSSVKNDEHKSESVFSETVGDDDGLKDNLLATVIDFQEQNNQEFIEIKNLMKQNNLLQRETNRLLRLMLEKM